ncbi:type II and III secretion system protein [Pararhodospirillum photometricum]|nr:type II and III secretion system protein [Pararhodospirillum photometricum]
MVTRHGARIVWGMVMALGTLGACAPFDPATGLEKEDYRALAGRKTPVPDSEPPIPSLIVPVAPPLPPPEDSRRVTLIAEKPTALTTLLVDLARVADLDLDMESGITGRVVMAARERPLPQVIERLADLGNLSLTLDNGVLHAAPDRPTPATYRLDVLNLARSAESSVSTSTDVFARVSNKSQTANSGNNASESRVASHASADPWADIADSLSQILGVQETRSRAERAARASASDAASPDPKEGTRANGALSPADPVSETGSDDKTKRARGSFNINRQAGVLSVIATRAQHRQVKAYLESIRHSLATQVLIEAKVLEVSLSDQYRGGIDWAALGDNQHLTVVLPGADGVVSAPLTDTLATLTLGGAASVGGVELSALAQVISRFGAVRTLSSPRMTVTNNQTGVLKVAQNEVYFAIDTNTTINDKGTFNTYSSQINTVPIGLVMTVQPSVDPDLGRITLGLRPTISRIASQVADPAVSLQNLDVESLVPVVEVRELDSVVSIDNGAVVVMGGLMQERQDSTRRGLPWLQDVPVLGSLFRTDLSTTEVVELVVLLRASVIGGNHAAPADRTLYETFAPDPRPLSF